jgi:TolA-binding protein
MSEQLEYIESYFQQKLTGPEKEEFEQRCVADEKFASEVAFYISSRSALNDLLLEQKRQEWSKIAISEEPMPVIGHDSQKISSRTPVRKINERKWFLFAAAACVGLALIIAPWFLSDSPQKKADEFVAGSLSSISQTMDGSRDSLQLGIQLYNGGQYDKAIALFHGVYSAHPDNSDALRFLGQTQLVQKKYDAAIVSFDELSKKQTYSNPGVFLKAVTLLKRNQSGDVSEARKLLEQVARENLYGSREAAKWLEDWSD